MTFTDDSKFLIADSIQKQLPAQFIIRPLKKSDYEKGFLICFFYALIFRFSSLSKPTYCCWGHYKRRIRRQVGYACGFDYYLGQFDRLRTANRYFVVVIENLLDNSVAACGTLLIEEKFIHKCGQIGHIEDIVVLEQHRGHNFGKM